MLRRGLLLMQELLIRATGELEADLRTAIIDLCDRAFDEETGPLLESFGPVQHVLLLVDGQIASHAVWVRRYLQAAAGPILDTAYVELVATEPQWRGRGFASAVLQAIIERTALGYNIAALSPSDVAFYARLGWEEWRGPLLARSAAGLELVQDETAMIHRLPRTPPLDLTAPLSIEWRQGEVW